MGQIVPLAQLVAYYAVYMLLLIWLFIFSHFASNLLACSLTSASVVGASDAASQCFSPALVLDCEQP